MNIIFDLLNRAPAPLGSRDAENLFGTHALGYKSSAFAGFLVHKCEVNATWTRFDNLGTNGFFV